MDSITTYLTLILLWIIILLLIKITKQYNDIFRLQQREMLLWYKNIYETMQGIYPKLPIDHNQEVDFTRENIELRLKIINNKLDKIKYGK